MAKRKKEENKQLNTLLGIAEVLKPGEQAPEKKPPYTLHQADIERGSKYHERYKLYLRALTSYIHAKRQLQKDRHYLLAELDSLLLKKDKISRSTYWTFKLINQKVKPLGEIVGGDLYITDADVSYETKVRRFLTELEAANLGVDFIVPEDEENGGEPTSDSTSAVPPLSSLLQQAEVPQEPQTPEPQRSAEDTAEGLSEDTATSEEDTSDSLPRKLIQDPTAYVKAYRKFRSIDKKVDFYRNQLTVPERSIFFTLLKPTERQALYDKLDEDEQQEVSYYPEDETGEEETDDNQVA